MSETWERGKCGRKNPPHRRKCQTWNCSERRPAQDDGGYWECGCGCVSKFASRSRCRLCGVTRGRCQEQQVQSICKPQSAQSSFADAVAEEAAKHHAQLGKGAVDLPMMGDGLDEVPSEEASNCVLYWRTWMHPSQLSRRSRRETRTCTRQAKQEKSKRVQAQLSALRPLKTRLRAAQEAHRPGHHHHAQSPVQQAAGLQNALDGEVKESFNQWLEQFGVQAHQSLPQNNSRSKCRRSCVAPFAFSKATKRHVEGAVHSVEIISIGSAYEDDIGRLFGWSRDSNHVRTGARSGNADGRSMVSEAGPHGFSW